MRIIHVLRKPLSESTVASNVLKHGCGGINIDASRISSTGDHMRPFQPTNNDREVYGAQTGFQPTNHAGGRWPANVILQHLDGCRCDGIKRVKPSNGSGRAGAGSSGFQTSYVGGDSKGAGFTGGSVKDDGKETVANWICEPGCPVARLDEQSGERKTTWIAPSHKNNRDGDFMGALNHPGHQGYNDTGGASRFYKQVGGGKVSE